MQESPTNYLSTILTIVGTIVVAYITYIVPLFVKQKLERKAAKQAIDYEIRFTISEMQGLFLRIDNLIANTRVDRFLMLKAENGSAEFKSATALIEQFRDKQLFYAVLLYDHVEIDDHYREMLKTAEAVGVYEIETKKLPKASRLKGFYEDEGVVSANLYYLARMTRPDGKATIFYLTVATKQNGQFTEREEREVIRVVEYMKKILKLEMERVLLINKGAL